MKRILLVDDDQYRMGGMEFVLTDDTDNIVEKRSSSSEVLNANNFGRYDLVICVHDPPTVAGDLLFRAFREMGDQVHFIFVRSEEDDVLRGAFAADRYFVLSLDQDVKDLLKRLKELTQVILEGDRISGTGRNRVLIVPNIYEQ